MNSNEIVVKIELVIEKLMNLEIAKNVGLEVDEKDLKVGLYPRDFGIEIWDWPQGVGLYGFHRYENFSKNEKYNTFIVDWFNRRITEGLPPKNINTTAPMITMIDYIEHDPKFKVLCDDWAEYLVNSLPKTKEDCFQHVTSDVTGTGVILNDSEMWIDTIFMAVLFLNKYGKKTKNLQYRNVARFQVLQHIKYLYSPKDQLFYHGYSHNDNTNFGEIFWNRGNSWFTYGIIDFLEMCIDEDLYLKKYILEVYKAQVDKLVKLQSEDGLWHTVLNDDSSYLEVSGSAAITAGILKGIRLGILPRDKYIGICQKAIKEILKNIDSEGVVQNVSGGTGMGMDADHYKNIIITPIAYGQSLVLIALNEYYIYLKNN